MALVGLRWDVVWRDVDDDVAGEGVATDVADESDLRGALLRGLSGGGEMKRKMVSEDGAVDTAALVTGAVSADEDDRVGHGLGCEASRAFGGKRRR